jgi:hypothetical protein
VRTASAVLVRDDGLIVEPTIAEYAAALRTSQAWAQNASSAPVPFVELSDEDGGGTGHRADALGIQKQDRSSSTYQRPKYLSLRTLGRR